MKRIYLSIIFMLFYFIAFTQKSTTKTISSSVSTKKYIIKISPTVKFNFTSAKKSNSNYLLPYSTMSTGFNANFLLSAKKNNYYDVGASIEVIPVVLKKPQYYNTSNGYKIGFEYSYRFVFVTKKKPSVSFFTAVGTQTNFIKTQSTKTDLSLQTKIYSAKSFELNVVFTPGIQYCKKSFFLDFSLPFGIGYNFTKQTDVIGSPVMMLSDRVKKFDLLNWNAGCKVGIGAKF